MAGNALHRVVKEGAYTEFWKFIDTHPVEKLRKWAITPDENDKLPIEFVDAREMSEDCKYKIAMRLLEIMLLVKTKPLSQLLHREEVFVHYYTEMEELKKNLEIARVIVNETRQLFTHSETHPDANDYPTQLQQQICKKIKKLRTNMQMQDSLHPLSFFESGLNAKDKLLQRRVELIKQEKVGNCREMSIVAYSLLCKKYPNVDGKIYMLEKGDHALLTLGVGEARVVCDPWGGLVYPYSQVNAKLEGCRMLFFDNRKYSVPINSKGEALSPFDDKWLHQAEMRDKKINQLFSVGLGVAMVALVFFCNRVLSNGTSDNLLSSSFEI